MSNITMSKKKAEKFYRNWGQDYKLDLLKDIEDKKISFYTLGEDQFTDLCRGPHVESTGEIKAIKLTRVSGAYWKGDEKNKMLTRIYGVAFETDQELEEYLQMMEEAEKRNHRKIGKEMELFAVFPEVGQGLPIWLPNGYIMRKTIENYMTSIERKYGYEHILTPHINKKELFETSGHLEFYKDSMYTPMKIDDEEYYLKPMNCPAGMMVYKMKTRSYRDLPMKIGESGTVYRYEKSGELHGLQRVRGFTQNDAHIFCTPEQLEKEFMEVYEMLIQFYEDVGFDNYKFYLATSDPDDEKYHFCGTKDRWNEAEETLRRILKRNNVEYQEDIGEAAFYGPKLDIKAVNVFCKEDTISTIQFDFNLPERFDLTYIDDKGEKQVPYVIHRAIIGSYERFFAFLIEYYGGAFPLWFAPQQAVIIPISTEKHLDYATDVYNRFKDLGLRVTLDDKDENLQSKIRKAELAKINYLLVVGDKEIESSTLSVRPQGGQNIGMIKVDELEGMLV
ncbi:MAG TPA: threonine--tRNA ligase, partial [bacterium]|nr:threonine--tRNA ligase [bacterium]